MGLVDLDSEKQELDAMVDRLSRSPRLAHLLRYLGDHYLSGQVSMLREFEIATEVFGRADDFDPAEDAIARVEAHRLRKKLKLYYETEGRNNPIRITIPSGSYTPVFTYVDTPVEPSEANSLNTSLYSEVSPPQPLLEPPPPTAPPLEPASPSHTRSWRLLALAVALALVCIAVFVWRHNSAPKTTEPPLPTPQVPSADAPIAGAVIPGKEVRIIAGYQGQPHIDAAGNSWLADRFFTRGGSWRNALGFTARTNDEFLYRTVRTGEFEYNIPLAPGVYELHLFFDETGFGPGIGGGEGSRSINILLNHQPLISNFDIESDAMGANVADEKVFRDISPGSDGKLNLEFDGVSGKPDLSAIEVLPGIPHKQLPIRLTAQPTRFIDGAGNVWNPDNYFSGGQSSLQKPPVTGTSEPGLFAMERWGHFSYALPVDPRGTYTLTLYFAEFYFGAEGQVPGGVGSRRFNVFCNGNTLLHDFDIFKEVGAMHAVSKTFRHLKPSPQGKLDIVFEPIANYANISAIEAVDESQ